MTQSLVRSSMKSIHGEVEEPVNRYIREAEEIYTRRRIKLSKRFLSQLFQYITISSTYLNFITQFLEKKEYDVFMIEIIYDTRCKSINRTLKSRMREETYPSSKARYTKSRRTI